MLEEKGLPYELIFTMPYDKRPEFAKASPSGYIPAMYHGDWHISDSSAMAAYLEKLHPEVPLYPAEPKAFAETLFTEEYADTFLTDHLHGFFMNRVAKPVLKREVPDMEKERHQLQSGMPWSLQFITDRLKTNDGYMVRGEITVADLMVGPLIWDLPLGHEPLNRRAWPEVASYFDRLMERPSFKKFIPIRVTYWMNYLERAFAKKRPFVFGDDISGWDVDLVRTTVDYIVHQSPVDLGQFPAATAYIDRVTNEPLYRQHRRRVPEGDVYMG